MFPKRERRVRLPKLMLALAGTLAACSAPPQIAVDHTYVRLSAVPHRPAAAYFTVHGGAANVVLLSISSDAAIKAEMHQSMSGGGMASMKPLDTLPVPARGTVQFAPGGRHLMLYDVNPGIVAGRRMKLTFVFSNGQRVDVYAPSVAAGAPVPDP